MSGEGILGSNPMSLSKVSPEVLALRKIKKFSLFSIPGYVLFTAVFVVGINLVSGNSKAFSIFGVFVLSMSIGAAVLLLISLIYLRSGFGILKRISIDVASPYKGTTFFFIGLSIVFLGASTAALLILLNHYSFTMFLGLVLVIGAGAFIYLVGEILALVLGFFRLKRHFSGSSYDTAGIMFIVGIFFPLFTLIGSVLVLTSTNSLINNAPHFV